jgi:tetratricopeptide (TPR) repeat protein
MGEHNHQNRDESEHAPVVAEARIDTPPPSPLAVVTARAIVRASVQQGRNRRRRRFASWHEHWTGEPLCTLLLGGLLMGAPQLLGGVLPWTVNAIAIASLICLGMIGLRCPGSAQQFPGLGLVLLAVSLWTAFQTLPLPCSWVAAVAPQSVAKLQGLRTIFGDSRLGVCTISQDPGATQLEIVKAVALVASFSVAWMFAATGGRRRVLGLIAGSTALMSVVALAHWVLEQNRVFGLYTPVGITRGWLLGPLMNPNNLGGFVAMGVPLFIGLGYRASGSNERLLSYVGLALTSTTAVLSLSRGAIGQLLASVVIMVFVVYRKRTQRTRKDRKALPLREIALATAGAGGLGLGAYLVGDEALRDFSSGKLDKLELGGRALRFAFDHALTGVGRGAFGSAFVGFEGSLSRYRYAENFVAQWAADWGLPVAAVLIGAIAYALYHAIRRSQSLAHISACIALIAFGAQNLVDFGIELVGIGVVAVALLAACLAPSPDEAELPRNTGSVLRRGSTVAAITLGVSLALLGLLGPRLTRQSVPALTAELRKSLAVSDRAGFRRKLANALALHPSEPVLTLMAASESLAHKDPKTLVWLNRAMQLAPGWSRPHELAFRWLWQHGEGRQALVELKAAAAVDPASVADAACRLGQVDAEWALSVAPDNDRRPAYLERLASCISQDPQSAIFDAAVLRELPNSVYPLWHEAGRRFQDGEVDEALQLIERLRRTHPEFQHAVVVRYDMLMKAGRLREVVSEIDTAMVGLSDLKQSELLRIKAMALASAGSMELAREALNELRRRSTTNPERLAQSYVLEGQIHLGLKEPGAALAAYREAYRINPDTITLRTIASIAESFGDRAQALWAYINLCQLEPLGGGCERRNALLSPREPNSGR